MNKNNECQIIRLPSGLYQGKVGNNLCFVVRNKPEEAMQDVTELFERLEIEKLND